MRAEWLQHRGAEGLIVVFGGWALSPAPFAHLTGEDDVLFAQDWRDLDHDLPEYAGYDRCLLLAHSFGVAAAGHWLASPGRRDPFQRKIAVNGTLFPCDPQRGIPPDLVRATAENLSPANLHRFCARAGSTPPSAPDLPALQAELMAVLARGPAPQLRFDRIWLGRQDRIFPPEALAQGFADQAEAIRWLDHGHTPFGLWQDWSQPCS